MKIDIVIPVLDEWESISILVNEIEGVAQESNLEPTVILVDDGSCDKSWETIKDLSSSKTFVRGVRLQRNFGKSAALQAGFEQCSSEIVFTMDADLQDDPKEISKFVDGIQDGADLVCGWKKTRFDGRQRKFLSTGFNRLVNWTTGMRLHDHNCGFKAFRREQLGCLQLDQGMHRFLTVMVSANGGSVTELIVGHRPRKFGKSKYGFGRVFRGFRGLMKVLKATRWGKRPMAKEQDQTSEDTVAESTCNQNNQSAEEIKT